MFPCISQYGNSAQWVLPWHLSPVLGVMEGARENKALWKAFLIHLKERGLTEASLFIADKHVGFIESFGEVFPDVLWQRCMVHFYRNIFPLAPNSKICEVIAMLKAIHAQEDLAVGRAMGKLVVSRLREMKLPEAGMRPSQVRSEPGMVFETIPEYGFA